MQMKTIMRAIILTLLCALASASVEAKDSGLVFVSNEKTNNIIVIDPKKGEVIGDIKVSRRPRDMHFNADRSLLYVACGDDDVIEIVDVAKLRAVGRLNTGPSP
jgi:DNA-binding beta-propeller fold protein YncE